jgi:putative hydrolases of HD superfamily
MNDRLTEFLATAMKLKTLKRAGWLRCGVAPCESVAEHTFGVALLALLASGSDVNSERCVALALVHDLAESLVGDITPHDAVSPEEKRQREAEAIDELAQLLGEDHELPRLWAEFENGKSPEAKLVRDLDVIEMAWQAVEYQNTGSLTAVAAAGFIDSARKRVTTSAGKKLLALILRNHK